MLVTLGWKLVWNRPGDDLAFHTPRPSVKFADNRVVAADARDHAGRRRRVTTPGPAVLLMLLPPINRMAFGASVMLAATA